MAAKTFNVRLVTPQGKLLDAPATACVIPAHDGQMGFLVDRAPIVVKLGKGPMRVDVAGGAPQSFNIEGGFGQMVSNRLTILTTKAG